MIKIKDFLTLQFGVPLNMQMELIGYDNSIQARLNECEITELNVDLTQSWVLSFKCPYKVTDELSLKEVINRNYKLLVEEKLIRLKVNDSYAVFVIKEINNTEDGYKEIVAYSLEKKITKEVVLDKATLQLKSDNVETGEGVFDKLEKSVRGWKLKYLDDKAKFENNENVRANKYRYFDSYQGSWINFLKESFLEAYSVLVLYDTYNKDIYCYDYKSYGQDTGFVISRKNIVNQLTNKLESNSLITKLYPSGKDGIGIENVCPYGAYVLDYSYFKSIMSKELQQALNVYELEVNKLFIQWKSKNDEITPIIVELGDLKNTKNQLLQRISAKRSELAVIMREGGNTSQSSSELSSLESQMASVESQIKAKEIVMNQKQSELAGITNSMQIENIISNGIKIFNDSLLDELEAYTYEGRLSNELHFKSESLYKWGLDKVKEVSKPSIDFNIGANDFLDDVEGYEGFNQKINLGDYFYIQDERLGQEKVRFLGYTYNPATRELNLKFSNKDKRNEFKGLTGTIKKFNNSDRVFNNKKTNWDLISHEKDFIKGIRENGFNAALSKVYSEHNKNKIEIDRDGIWLSNAENPNEIIVVTSSCIIVSNDGLKTAKACVTADGIIGEEIIGKILAGEKLYISNKNNNFIIDQNGIRIDVNSFKVRTSNGDNTVTGLLEMTSEALKTQFTNADKGLENKMNITAEGLKGDIKNTKEGLQANIDANARSLTTKFQEADGQLNSKIEQNARTIQMQVNNVQDNVNTQIRMMDREISSKVSEGEVSSIIKQSASEVQYAFNDISASVRINSSGLYVDNGTIQGVDIIGATFRGGRFIGDTLEFGDIETQQLHTRGHAELYQGCSISGNLTVNSSYRDKGDIWAAGIIACGGEKSCIQHTDHYGDISFYSLEFAESYLGDKGFGHLVNGECRIDLDPRVIESVNTDSYYHVHLDKYGECEDIYTSETHRDYFIVKGKKDIRFGWTLEGKRRGFENRRLKEVFNLIPKEFGGEA